MALDLDRSPRRRRLARRRDAEHCVVQRRSPVTYEGDAERTWAAGRPASRPRRRRRRRSRAARRTSARVSGSDDPGPVERDVRRADVHGGVAGRGRRRGRTHRRPRWDTRRRRPWRRRPQPPRQRRPRVVRRSRADAGRSRRPGRRAPARPSCGRSRRTPRAGGRQRTSSGTSSARAWRKMAAGRVQLAPPGGLRAAQDLGDLGHGSVLEVEEHDHRTLLGREAADGGEHLGGRASAARLASSLDGRTARARPAPGPVTLALGLADGHAAHPQVGPVVPGHRAPVPEQLEERVLGDLLGAGAVADDVVDGARDARELAGEDVLEGRRSARPTRGRPAGASARVSSSTRTTSTGGQPRASSHFHSRRQHFPRPLSVVGGTMGSAGRFLPRANKG